MVSVWSFVHVCVPAAEGVIVHSAGDLHVHPIPAGW